MLQLKAHCLIFYLIKKQIINLFERKKERKKEREKEREEKMVLK